jgi:hypothetical protein
MATCDMCGNEYANAMQITVGDETHTFDSFECAIHMIAPRCTHCGCTILGHGLESGEATYCCAHCARKDGVEGLADHA